MASFKQLKFYLLLLSGLAISLIGIYIFFTSSITTSFLRLGTLTYAPDFISKIPGFTTEQSAKNVTISQNGNSYTITAQVANTESTREKGLMGVKSMSDTEGMLFVFDSSAIQNFWMKNTLIPLDMIFIDDTGTVVYIQNDAPPCTADPCPIYTSQFQARYTLEVNGGWSTSHNISSGAKVTF